MTRCAHTGLTIPECSCRACLITLVQTHAPRPATDPGATTLPSLDVGEDRPQAA
jgi:hypothetical protein